jgi:transposase InsO family protein
VKYSFIAAHAERWSVSRLCSALGVSRSGYYGWARRMPSRRSVDDAVLLSRLRLLFRRKRRHYGSPRLHALLRREGFGCSRRRVARLMQRDGLQAVTRRRRRATPSELQGRLAPNLLQQEFAPGGREAWLADLTYIRCTEGWCYLAVVLQLRTRKVLGYCLGRQPGTELCLGALEMALGRGKPSGVLHHSDRGSTYTSRRYLGRLEEAGLEISMSGKGNCYDNAVIESFFSSLKREVLRGRMLLSHIELKVLISEYIEQEYNQERMHSSLGYLSPDEYEKQLSCA